MYSLWERSQHLVCYNMTWECWHLELEKVHIKSKWCHSGEVILFENFKLTWFFILLVYSLTKWFSVLFCLFVLKKRCMSVNGIKTGHQDGIRNLNDVKKPHFDDPHLIGGIGVILLQPIERNAVLHITSSMLWILKLKDFLVDWHMRILMNNNLETSCMLTILLQRNLSRVHPEEVILILSIEGSIKVVA